MIIFISLNLKQSFTVKQANTLKFAIVTVLEKRDHLATNIIFELCTPSKKGHCELQNGL